MFLNPLLFLRKGGAAVGKKQEACSQKIRHLPPKEIKPGAHGDLSTFPISIPNFRAWNYRKKTSEN
jgi:hypothetical protein